MSKVKEEEGVGGVGGVQRPQGYLSFFFFFLSLSFVGTTVFDYNNVYKILPVNHSLLKVMFNTWLPQNTIENRLRKR